MARGRSRQRTFNFFLAAKFSMPPSHPAAAAATAAANLQACECQRACHCRRQFQLASENENQGRYGALSTLQALPLRRLRECYRELQRLQHAE